MESLQVEKSTVRKYKGGGEALIYSCPCCKGEVKITVNALGKHDYVANCEHFIEYDPAEGHCIFLGE